MTPIEELATQLQGWQATKTNEELAAIIERWEGREPAGAALLIEMQHPGAVDVRPYVEWIAAGRKPHGPSIKLPRRKERQVTPNTIRQYYEIVHVFDVSQTTELADQLPGE
jgi:hypothetical protein